MISYFKEIDFSFDHANKITLWLNQVIENEGYKPSEINYIFCDDDCLLEKNIQFLNHDTLTDIISFDYSSDKEISGDIFISIDRVKENATDFGTNFEDELMRVMVHGILHFCGYKDKTPNEKKEMRSKEDYYLSLRTF